MFPPKPMPPGGGLPPMGGPPDPMAGLMPPPGGAPMGPPPPGMPPMGGGPQLPFGGAMPGQDDDVSGSPLLQALMASFGGDQGQPTDLNVGQGDPQMGVQDLLNMLALGGAGVGGPGGPMGGQGPAAGNSGVDRMPMNPGMGASC